jgi:hypothetical protein
LELLFMASAAPRLMMIPLKPGIALNVVAEMSLATPVPQGFEQMLNRYRSGFPNDLEGARL